MNIPSAIDGKLRELMRVFLAENANINLSALRTEESCWVGNIEDSLAALDVPLLSQLMTHNSKLLDIGTGGGFPLLPLAVAYPEVRFTGLDSIKKKIDAITRIASAAQITNVATIAERAEILGQQSKHREQYDVVTSRAVAPLNILLEYCAPFAKVNGLIVLWKSLHIDDELSQSKKAQDTLHCRLETSHSYTLPLDFGTRQLLIFRKVAKLDRAYPRPIGEAKKTPLNN